ATAVMMASPIARSASAPTTSGRAPMSERAEEGFRARELTEFADTSWPASCRTSTSFWLSDGKARFHSPLTPAKAGVQRRVRAEFPSQVGYSRLAHVIRPTSCKPDVGARE